MSEHENRLLLDELFGQDAFAKSLGVEVAEWVGGSARIVGTPGRRRLNFGGGVHGGYLFSLADVALSIASNSWGRACVATSVDIHYVAAADRADVLEASATEINRGRNLATYQLEVRHDSTLHAVATGVVFRTRDWHFGAEAWTDAWREAH